MCISSQLPRLIRVDTWKSGPMVSSQSDRNYVPHGNGSSWAEILRKELILIFETISHFVLGVVAIAILHIALTYGMSDKTNDNPKIRFLKTVCFVGAFVGANIMIIFFIYIIVRSPLWYWFCKRRNKNENGNFLQNNTWNKRVSRLCRLVVNLWWSRNFASII